MSNSTDELMQQAINAGKSGDKAAAKNYLTQVVKINPRDARAWYMLSQVVDSKEQAIYCLRKTLEIDPSNPRAVERLQKLELAPPANFATQEQQPKPANPPVQTAIVRDAIDEYNARINQILGLPENEKEIRLSLSFDTPQEARLMLAKIRQMQKELKFVKKDMTLTMQEVRSGYTAEKSTVHAGFLATLSGKKAAGSDRARKKEQIRVEQERVLAPYKNLSSKVDQILIALDRAKLQIDEWMTKNRISE